MTISYARAARKSATPEHRSPAGPAALDASATGSRAPVGMLYGAGPAARLDGWMQPKLEIGGANSPLESEADRVAGQVMAGTGPVHVQPAAAAASVVSRQEKEGLPAPAATETKEAEVGFGSPAAPWFVLKPSILQLPSRWKAAASKSAGELSLDDQELYANFTGALQNLLYAGMLTEMSSYKPDFSKGLEAAESLSGVTDTYLKLASFAVQKDIEKYLSKEAKPVIMENLGWMVIYGLFLQGGLVGLNGALEKDLNFTSVIGPAVKPFTEAPLAYKSYQEGVKAPFNTGLSLGTTWRNPDPFDPSSGRLFSIGGKLTILDMLIFSAEHHQISQETPTPGMPTQDTRFMLFLGPGTFRR